MKHDTSCAVPKEDRWLTDYWYETLDDPPEPPPRETSRIITVTLNPDPPSLAIIPAHAPFPLGEGRGEATFLSI